MLKMESLLCSYTPVSIVHQPNAVPDSLLQELLETERQGFSSDIDHLGNVCSRSIESPCTPPCAYYLVIWESLDIAMSSIAF